MLVIDLRKNLRLIFNRYADIPVSKSLKAYRYNITKASGSWLELLRNKRGRSESNTVIFHSNPPSPSSRGIFNRCGKQMVTGSSPARSPGNLYSTYQNPIMFSPPLGQVFCLAQKHCFTARLPLINLFEAELDFQGVLILHTVQKSEVPALVLCLYRFCPPPTHLKTSKILPSHTEVMQDLFVSIDESPWM